MFKDYTHCPLVRARAQVQSGLLKKFSREHYKGRCCSPGCPECGKEPAIKFHQMYEHVIRTIEGDFQTLILTWSNLPTNDKAVESTVKFKHAFDALRRWLRDDTVLGRRSPIAGAIASAECNFVPGTKGTKFQLHIHLLVFMDKQSWLWGDLHDVLRSKWKKLGGKSVLRPFQEFHASAQRFLDYVTKHPICLTDTETNDERLSEWRSNLVARVLKPAKDRLRGPVLGQFTTGILHGHRFRQVIARAHYDATKGIRQRLLHPGGKLPRLPPGIRVVLRPWCPHCRASDRHLNQLGDAAGGLKRYYCRRCEGSFTFNPLSPFALRLIPGTRVSCKEGSKIHRWRKKGFSVSEIAEHVGRSPNTVKKVIAYYKDKADKGKRAAAGQSPQPIPPAPSEAVRGVEAGCDSLSNRDKSGLAQSWLRTCTSGVDGALVWGVGRL